MQNPFYPSLRRADSINDAPERNGNISWKPLWDGRILEEAGQLTSDIVLPVAGHIVHGRLPQVWHR